MACTSTIGVEDWIAVNQLLAEHWTRVDRVLDRPPAELYTRDASISIGTLVKNGGEEIDAYYAERRAQEDASGRRVRHLATNLLVEQASEDKVDLRFLITVFAGVGETPLASEVPSSIGDFRATCLRHADGHWLIQLLHGTPIFAGAAAPPNVARPS